MGKTEHGFETSSKFYPEFVRSESRQKMCVLRRLCLKKRAKMLKKKQYRAREAKRIQKKLEEEEREKMKLKPTFPDFGMFRTGRTGSWLGSRLEISERIYSRRCDFTDIV